MLPLQVRFISGSRRGQKTAFHHSPVRAGRSRDSDLLVPELTEPLSSGRHAEFVFEDGHWWVVDCASTNGTRLNGLPVSRARLQDRDRLSFRDVDLEVRVGAARHLGRAALGAALIVLLAIMGWVAWEATRRPLDAIASAARRSVYLLTIHDAERRTAVGTAFAVDASGQLVTNAHVAAPLAALLATAQSPIPYAVGADDPERPRRITGIRLHPGWREGSISNDVALVTVEQGPALSPLQLARSDQLAALEPGVTVAIFGFPAAFTDPDRPLGSLAVNVLREVRGSRYLVVGVAVTAGSSGSPVFAIDGTVVGMIVGSGRAGAGNVGTEVNTSPGVALSAAVVREVLQ
ncbi:hypothetical protein BH23ACI1_BH23ACI1_30780 [soil metagenome]